MTFCCDKGETFAAVNSRRGHCPDEFLPNKAVSDTTVSEEVLIKKTNRQHRRMTVIKQISSKLLELIYWGRCACFQFTGPLICLEGKTTQSEMSKHSDTQRETNI